MDQRLEAKLRSFFDQLRASDTTQDLAELTASLLFLKLLDEEEATGQDDSRDGASSLFPDQAQRYRWSKWRERSQEMLRFVQTEVLPYMASLVREDAQVASFFSDARLEIASPKAFEELVRTLDDFRILSLPLAERGRILEEILGFLDQESRNDSLRTPPSLRRLLVEMLDPTADDLVGDPVCGTGGFLVDSVDHIIHRTRLSETVGDEGHAVDAVPQDPDAVATSLDQSIFGFDINRRMVRIATINLILNGIRHPRVKRANSLSEDSDLDTEDVRRHYTILFANPPFGARVPDDYLRRHVVTKSRNGDLLFLSLLMERLAPGGYCAVVVPTGVLFQTTSAHVELRHTLCEQYHVLAVISLPAGIFAPVSSIEANVIIFRKPAYYPHASKSPRKVWFYKLPQVGQPRYSARRASIVSIDEGRANLLHQWKVYRAGDFLDPPGSEANSLLPVGAEIPPNWWALLTTVAENHYSLHVDTYQPSVATQREYEDPFKLIGGLLKIEEEIQAGLHLLRQDLERKP